MKLFWISLLLIFGLHQSSKTAPSAQGTAPYVVVLGTVQDGGSPHIGCQRECCAGLFKNPDPTRMVVSLGIVDPGSNRSWLIEATPDLPAQLSALEQATGADLPVGIFITHAHIGHYTGLMYLGREAKGARQMPVYAMPRLQKFLEGNGPWNQLVKLENIAVQPMSDRKTIRLSENLSITPFLVPHRDEYSETIGFKVEGPSKTLVFIPDINKWEVWEQSITAEISKCDYALLDGTFYSGEEIGYRNISEIPHPFITESMQLFSGLPPAEREKVHFIHLNHTNPLLDTATIAYKSVIKQGYRVAQFGQQLQL